MSDTIKTVTEKEHRTAKAWYIKYNTDAYAMGPIRYNDFVGADRVVEEAEQAFGYKPHAVWPTETTQEVGEYEYELTESE